MYMVNRQRELML